jgi:hypothetical protein
MRWSYTDYLLTPVPVIDEVVALMKEIQDEAEREKNRPRRRR